MQLLSCANVEKKTHAGVSGVWPYLVTVGAGVSRVWPYLLVLECLECDLVWLQLVLECPECDLVWVQLVPECLWACLVTVGAGVSVSLSGYSWCWSVTLSVGAGVWPYLLMLRCLECDDVWLQLVLECLECDLIFWHWSVYSVIVSGCNIAHVLFHVKTKQKPVTRYGHTPSPTVTKYLAPTVTL